MRRFSQHLTLALAGVSLLLLSGCDSHHEDMAQMMGPSQAYMGAGGYMGGSMAGMPGLVSVDPPGGATGVPVSTSVVFRFGIPMASGMNQFVDLHTGDVGGPIVPWTCTWSHEHRTLTCTPASPLEPLATYTVHVGGGMVDASGRLVDPWGYGSQVGGSWVMTGMMGGHLAGGGWGHMGSGWRHPVNGSYGMAFSFRTA